MIVVHLCQLFAIVYVSCQYFALSLRCPDDYYQCQVNGACCPCDQNTQTSLLCQICPPSDNSCSASITTSLECGPGSFFFIAIQYKFFPKFLISPYYLFEIPLLLLLLPSKITLKERN